MLDKNVLNVMTECNNYFARVIERVSGCKSVGTSVTCESGFEGKYSPGNLLRVHGAFCADYGAFDAGECYEVVEFDGETLVLDHELHTKATWLLVVYCEPTADFLALCDEIAAYEEKNASRKGLQSESIDGYSWSAASSPNGVTSGTDYRAVYADALKPYRIPRVNNIYHAREAQPWR